MRELNYFYSVWILSEEMKAKVGAKTDLGIFKAR